MVDGGCSIGGGDGGTAEGSKPRGRRRGEKEEKEGRLQGQESKTCLCCQNILYLKYYTLFWQSLRIILYSYFLFSQIL